MAAMEADALVVAESLALGLVAIIVGILAALALAMVIYAYAVTETRPDPIALPRDRAGLLELYEQACRIEGQSGGGLVAAVVEGVGRDFDAPRLRKALAAPAPTPSRAGGPALSEAEVQRWAKAFGIDPDKP